MHCSFTEVVKKNENRTLQERATFLVPGIYAQSYYGHLCNEELGMCVVEFVIDRSQCVYSQWDKTGKRHC